MELINTTHYPAQLVVAPDPEGFETLTAVLKMTLAVKGGDCAPAEEQVPLVLGDTFFGEPGESSTRLECDLAPFKAATDVVMIGHAYATKKSTRGMDVSLAVGKTARTVRVWGDRHWWLLLGVQPRRSAPKPFEKMPLVYERAYGGAQPARAKGKFEGFEERNPVGTGYVRKKRRSYVDGLALPNLEDPRRPIRRLGHRPPPAGFGFIGRGWMPRRALMGTYDDAWKEERAPLLPQDFDPRSWNGAHPALQVEPYLAGDERVRANGVSKRGRLEFTLPGLRPSFEADWLGRPHPLEPVLDTLVLEPDEMRVCLTWRARLRIHGNVRRLRMVRMKVAD
jgi:hypothetical protein